ncbi:MAG: M20 family metallo-hydrolase [Desulfovibrionales bacterium]|nr:M20 family metallo-hydrolase [Desulfovibrionales bacterium]
MFAPLCSAITSSVEELVHLQTRLVAIPALSPVNGGTGEHDKVAFLRQYLHQFPDVELRTYLAPDDRVPSGSRPSLIVKRPGASSRTLWLIAHTDVVPVGDLNLWSGDPFVLRRNGDTLIGRGVEDNHQGLVSALLVLRALELTKTQTELSLGIVMVADEETSNAWGMEYLLEQHPEIFGPDDLIVIPDFGTPDGLAIEVTEKSVLWQKFVVQGKQCHASTPDQGVNSLIACSALVLALDKLHQCFDYRDPLFAPPYSTFTPTKKDANVSNINTIPGQDVVYLDCRILPRYDLQKIELAIRAICDSIEAQYHVRILTEPVVRHQAAPGTPPHAPVAQALAASIQATRQQKPYCVGIGGGTVAACFRRRGISAVCWSTLNNTAHQPDESSSIAHTLADAQTLAHLLLTGADAPA